MPKTHSALLGIALAIGACACFAVLDTIAKHISATVPVLMALWARYFFQALVTSVWVFASSPEGGGMYGWLPRTAHPRFHALRALLFTGTGLMAFLSLRVMPLAEFTAITAAAPLCVTLVAALWLRQPVNLWRWVLIVVGLLSVWLILHQGAQPQQGTATPAWAVLLPLGMLVLVTGYQVLSSLMAGQEAPATTQFYTGWLATALLTPMLPWAWAHIASLWVWLGLFVMGVLSALGHLLLLRAYARAKPATLAPFLYTQIGFAVIGGWLVFGHIPGTQALLGMALITASGIASAWLTVRGR